MDRLTVAMLQGQGKRQFTAEERDSVQDVLDAAAAWDAGAFPLTNAANLGTITYQGIPSPRYTRFVAIVTTPAGDPRRAALLRMIDRIVAANRIVTRFGVMDRDEFHQHDAAIAAHATRHQSDLFDQTA